MDFQLVEKAYAAVIDDGKKPSLRNVRQKIGGGSYSDIGPLIAEVERMRRLEAVAAMSLTPEVKELAEGFVLRMWSAMHVAADERVKQSDEAAEKRVAEAQAIAKAALGEADRLVAELDAGNAERERIAAALEEERAARIGLEKELAIAEGRHRDAVRRAAGLQRSLDLAISPRAGAGVALPKSPDVTAAEMATIYGAIRQQLLEDLPLNEVDLGDVPGLVNLPHQTTSEGLAALVAAGLIRATDEGALSLPPPDAGKKRS